jgi:hypothetical protein
MTMAKAGPATLRIDDIPQFVEAVARNITVAAYRKCESDRREADSPTLVSGSMAVAPGGGQEMRGLP